MKSPAQDEFYVGYLPLPPSHRRALVRALSVLLVFTCGLAIAMAMAQRDPGAALWDTGQVREWTGVMQAIPYPILIDDADGSALLIVEQSKRGPRESATAPGRHARLRGWLLERNGRRMIELAPEEDAVQIGEPATQLMADAEGAEVELRGEILDAKCYLGAMKPGDGKTHKACATLCIQGGIPPMFFTRGLDGTPEQYLIVADATDKVDVRNIVAPFIGEPVQVRGRIARMADMPILVIGPGAVRRQ